MHSVVLTLDWSSWTSLNPVILLLYRLLIHYKIADVDECQVECDSTHTSDCHNCSSRSNERCSNTDGSYECICKAGFHGASEGCKGKLSFSNPLHYHIARYQITA